MMYRDLVEVLLARQDDEAEAFEFLGTGSQTADRTSYRELIAAARGAAMLLHERGAVGERVLIVCSPGRRYLEWFMGCVLAGSVPVPAPPPSNSQRARRMHTLIADAGARFAVGGPRQRRLLDGKRLHWIDEDESTITAPTDLRVRPPGADGVAFLQYTSGSTSRPRGVMVTHGALLANLAHITAVFGLARSDVGVSWLPPYHDMGLIGGMLVPVLAGFPMVLMDPVAFSRDPLTWIRAVSGRGATVSGAPSTAFELAARALTGFDGSLDLSRWRTAFVGAEPIHPATLHQFAVAAGRFGFDPKALRPCYGLAEATLMVTCARAGTSVAMATSVDEVTAVSCGPPVEGLEVRIVDPHTLTEKAAGEIGEVWVRGPSVTAGYWQAPEATNELFVAQLDGIGHLRTGDLGFLTPAGELAPTGRLKDLLIIRGRNVYPQDIEAAARRAAEHLEPAMAAAFDVDGEPVVLVECTVPKGTEDMLLEAMRDAVLAECDARPAVVALVRRGTLPRTTSGKIQRRLTRERFEAGECAVVAVLGDTIGNLPDVADPREITLFLRERLVAAGFPVAPEDDPALSALGLDSLFVTRIAAELNRAAGGRLAVAEVWRSRSLSELGAIVARSRPDTGESAAPADDLMLIPAPPFVQLTGTPVAMWLAEQLHPGSTNIWFAGEVSGLSSQELVSRVRAAVTRHDAFGTTFRADGERVLAYPGGESAAMVSMEEGTHWSPTELRERLAAWTVEPIDLGRAPLLRVHIIRRGVDRVALLLVAPHLVLDFQGLGVLARELLTGRPTATGAATFYDLLRAGPEPAGDRGVRYGLALPFRRDPALPSAAAAEVRLELSAETTRAVRSLAMVECTTPFGVLLALYAVALQRTSGQDWVTVGVPESGRRDPRFADTVGLAMRQIPVTIERAGSVRAVLGQVAEELRTASDRPADPVAPTFETIFAFNSAQGTLWPGLALFEICDGVEVRSGEVVWRSVHLPRALDSVPLTVLAGERAGRTVIVLRYLCDYYRAEDVRHLGDRIVEAAGELTRSRPRPAPALPLPPITGTLVSGLGAMAERHGDCTALTDGVATYTYRQLWEAAVSAAGALTARGVRPGDRVGILHERTAGVIVASLGVLVAGAAFSHLDTSSPPSRLQDMIDDADLGLVVTSGGTEAVAGELRVEQVNSAALVSSVTVLPTDQPQAAAAYVSFTSGSSGRPKGVVVSHRAAVTAVHGVAAPIALGVGDALCAISRLGWDLSLSDIFCTLLRGATLVLAGEEYEVDGVALGHFLARHRITVMQTTPQRWRLLLRTGWRPPPGFRAVCGGDSMTAADVERFDRVGVHVWNYYGPTEATFWATCHDFGEPSRIGEAPIGRPLARYETHLLDERGALVPAGAVGELFIAGPAVADGYVDQPRLTGERFVPDPFSMVPGSRMYRTGDLVRARADVGLIYVGRTGGYTKMRGYRVELGEIESVLATATQVREVAVRVVAGSSDADDAELAAYVVAETGAELDLVALNRHCARRLPQHMIPTRYAVLPALPVNTNGKIDRASLADVPVTGVHGVPRNRPGTPTERLVADVFCQVLDVAEVDLQEDFFLNGGYSLRALRAAARLQERTGVTTGIRDLFVHRTVERLARWLDGEHTSVAAVVLSTLVTRPGAVLRGQQRLWTLQQLTGSTSLNVPMLLSVTGCDVEVVRIALDRVVARHPMVHAVYQLVDRTVTRIQRPGPVAAVCRTAATAGEGEVTARSALAELLAQPWSLEEERPIRAAVVDVPGTCVLIALVVHHVAIDGWSARILLADLGQALNGPLTELTNLDDVVARIAARESDEATRTHVAYFVDALGDVPMLPLPLPGSAVVARPARVVRDLGSAVHEAAGRLSSTPFAVSVAALARVLSLRVGVDRLVVGLDVANRVSPEAEPHVGYFAGQVPVVLDPGGAQSFPEVAARTLEALLTAVEHGTAPYEAIVAETRRRGHTAERLFDVKVMHQELPADRIDGHSGSIVEVRDAEHISEQDPLSLWVRQGAGSVVFELHHRPDACDLPTAEALLDDIVALIYAFTDDGRPKEHEETSTASPELAQETWLDFDDVGIGALELDPAEVVVSVDGRVGVGVGVGTNVLLVRAGELGADAAGWLRAHEETWRAGLREHGAVLLRGFGISSAQALATATDGVFGAAYSTAEHPRQLVGGRVVTPVAYSSKLDLLWHNEDTFNNTWPALISFACSRIPAVGGHTTFVDGARVLSAFTPEERAHFERAGVTYLRRFHSGLGLPWQTVFGTDDPSQVERVCAMRGESVAWEEGVLSVRATRPALRIENGTPVWIAQILHWHETCLPTDVRDQLYATVGDRLPRSCAYGDGSPIAQETVQRLMRRCQEIEYALDWQVGDAIIVDNRRMAHGRRAYRGERGVLVALGDPIRHVPYRGSS